MSLFFTEYHDRGIGLRFKIKKELFYKHSKFQEIAIYETESFGKLLVLDGLVMLTERDEFVYHEMLVHPAFAFHTRIEKVGIIGGGDGGTVREVLKYPEVKLIKMVEIDKDVVEASLKYLPEISKGLKDPKVEILYEDGVKFLKENRCNFDLLLIDSSDPIGPAQVLYSMDFYHQVAKNIKEDGIVVFQSESPWHHLNVISKQFFCLKKLFKDVRIYLASIPTYPGGLWSFTIASHRELIQKREIDPPDCKYFNSSILQNLFYLPEFIKNAISQDHGFRDCV